MQGSPKRELTLLDSTCLIVGIIVGVGIYQVAPDVAKGSANSAAFLGLWLLGGAVSLAGALGYAELASAYPQAGGDYAFLTRAYGSWAGFLFGWIQLLIVRPGDIAVMAFAFATYARTLWNPFGDDTAGVLPFYACAAVMVLTTINILGVRQGKWTQNVLTIIKVIGLLAIVAVGLLAPTPASSVHTSERLPASLALIFVLFTFGGWNEMAYVAAEIRNPSRNILRALLLGTTAVTALYLLINGAFLRVLGFDGLAASDAVAVQTVATAFPQNASSLVGALVCLSALGAVNGLIFAGARISFAVGRDHHLFRRLGVWSERTGTPTAALLAQGLLAVGLIVALGSFVNTLLYTAAPVYVFYLATNLAVIILRRKDPSTPRPYRVWGYPVTPLIFCATCGFLIYSAVTYKPVLALTALGFLLLGLPVYALSRRFEKPAEPSGIT